MSAPDLPRFKVSSVTGYGSSSGARKPSIAYYVLDTWDNHRVVATFPIWSLENSRGAGRNGRIPSVVERGRRAYARCVELEEWHRREMAR